MESKVPEKIKYRSKFRNTPYFESDLIRQISSICLGKHNVMISIYDTIKNRFIYCSDSFEKNLGYGCEELCQGGWKYWFDKINPAHVAHIKKTITYYLDRSLLFRKHRPIHLTYQIKGRGGSWFRLHHEIRPYGFMKELFLFNFLYDTTQHEAIHNLLSRQKPNYSSNMEDTDVHISQRENEVLNLLAEGLSSKQIAGQLFICTQTVLSHRKHLMEKFKVKNTPQLIKKAILLQKLGVFYDI